MHRTSTGSPISWEAATSDLVVRLSRDLLDEWLTLGDLLGVSWAELQVLPSEEQNGIDGRIYRMLEQYIEKPLPLKTKETSVIMAFQKMNKAQLAQGLKRALDTASDRAAAFDSFVNIDHLGSHLKAPWTALLYGLEVDWDDDQENGPSVALTLNEKAKNLLKFWLVYNDLEITDRIAKLADILKKFNMEYLATHLPRPESVLFENTIIFHTPKYQLNATGQNILIKIETNGQQFSRKWVEVSTVDPTQVPQQWNASPASDIVKLVPTIAMVPQFKKPIGLCIPYKVHPNPKDHESVLCKLEGAMWQSVSSKCVDSGYITLQIEQLDQPLILVVINRLIMEKVEIGQKGGVIQSKVDKEVKVNISKDTFDGQSQIELQVETTSSGKQKLPASQTMKGITPIVHMCSKSQPSKPSQISAPLHTLEGTSLNGSVGSLTVMESQEEGVWEPRPDIKATADKGIAHFDMRMSKFGSSVMLLSGERGTSQRTVAEYARKVDDVMHAHIVCVILKQHKLDLKKVAIVCVKRENVESSLEVLRVRGYSDGPELETNEFVIREKQKVRVGFAEGCLDFPGGRHHDMVFSAEANTAKHNSRLVLRPNSDPQELWGIFRADLLKKDGKLDEDVSCELVVTLPPPPERAQSLESVPIHIFDGPLTTQTGQPYPPGPQIPIFDYPSPTPDIPRTEMPRIPSRQPSEVEKISRDITAAGLKLKEVPSVMKGWLMLGRRLISGADMEELKSKPIPIGEAICQMLEIWVQKEGSQASIDALTQALVEEKMMDAVEILRTVL